jgi:hypothetical protein
MGLVDVRRRDEKRRARRGLFAALGCGIPRCRQIREDGAARTRTWNRRFWRPVPKKLASLWQAKYDGGSLQGKGKGKEPAAKFREALAESGGSLGPCLDAELIRRRAAPKCRSTSVAPLPPKGNRRPRSTTRPSGGSPDTTKPSASKRGGGGGPSSRKAPPHDCGARGGTRLHKGRYRARTLEVDAARRTCSNLIQSRGHRHDQSVCSGARWALSRYSSSRVTSPPHTVTFMQVGMAKGSPSLIRLPWTTCCWT